MLARLIGRAGLAPSAPSATATTAPLTLAGVPLRREQEVLHILLAGATGVGKSVAITELLLGIARRGERFIVADPNGFYASRFGRDGDTLLNPFDRRSPGWSPFAEVRKPHDFDIVARAIVPDGHGPDAAWHFYAQTLIADVMRALMGQGKSDTAALIEALTTWDASRLGSLVAGSAAAGLFDADASRALASTRFIIASHLKAFAHLRPGDFGLRQWLQSGRGNLFLTWREDMNAALAPLLACWIDLLCTAALSQPPEPGRRLWLILDELASLGKISSLEAALTKGRKHGLCCVAGVQSTAQLERIYGREGAIVLRSCFRNFAAFAVARADPDTAETFSRALGERETDRGLPGQSSGAQGRSDSVSIQRVRERAVLASEICELPDLQAYLALAGPEPVRLVRFAPVNLPQRAEPFEER